MRTRRYSNKVGSLGAGLAREAAQHVLVVNDAGEHVRVRVQADAPKGLLGQLLQRGGHSKPSDAARTVARIWDEVTDGAGVVLDAAGRPVEPGDGHE